MKFAFLNGPLEKVVYVTQPSIFENKGKEEMIFKLNKIMYELKQAPKVWDKRYKDS